MDTVHPLHTWSTMGQLIDLPAAVQLFDLNRRLRLFMIGPDDACAGAKVRLVHGDLAVAGHLMLDWQQGLGAQGLIVTGHLSVDGAILNRDTGGGPFLLVEGGTRARAIVGSGAELRFCGDVTVDEIVIGEYNDGSLRFDGRLSVPVVVSNDHDLEIGGGLDGRWLDPFNEGDDWAAVLHPEIPVPGGDGGGDEGDFEIDAHLVPRLLAGLPVLRSDLPPLDQFPLQRRPTHEPEVTPTLNRVPSRALGLAPMASAACGLAHTLLLTADGTVRAWGDNGSGQVGNGTISDTDVRAPARALADMAGVACGRSHSLAVGRDGSVWAWGAGASGQLGTGRKTANPCPKRVPGIHGVRGLAAGEAHSLAVQADGSVWAWGSNHHGALGTEGVEGSDFPLLVAPLAGIVAVAAGKDHSLALASTGEVWSWGRNQDGQLGDGSTRRRASPVAVTGLPKAIAIAAGRDHSLAIDTEGRVWTWGGGSSGELGNGRMYDERSTPGRVDGLDDVVAVAAGTHCLAIRSDGTLWSWGANFGGQLGDGSKKDRAVPGPVPHLADVVAVSAGHAHSIVIRRDGSVWVWGDIAMPG